MIIGHSHHQFIYENSGFELINPGSVGQNRKYIDRIDYLVFYSDENRFELKSTTYNLQLLISEMIRQN